MAKASNSRDALIIAETILRTTRKVRRVEAFRVSLSPAYTGLARILALSRLWAIHRAVPLRVIALHG
jgi:hypothetical protein